MDKRRPNVQHNELCSMLLAAWREESLGQNGSTVCTESLLGSHGTVTTRPTCSAPIQNEVFKKCLSLEVRSFTILIQFSVHCDFLWLPASHAAHPHFPLSLTQTLPPKRLCHCPSPSFQLETPAPSPARLLVILQIFKVPPSLQPSSPSPLCSTALYRNLNAALVSYHPQQSSSLPPLLGCSVLRSRDLVFVFSLSSHPQPL